MDKTTAQIFWEKIGNTINCAEEVAAEGNSGEFHDPDEKKRLEREYRKSLKVLIDVFELHTGWRPIMTRPRKHNNYVTGWKFHRR